jgi:hypothetical protein
MANGTVPPVGQSRPTPGRQVAIGLLYVNKVGGDGWLQTRQADAAGFISLAKYTKLQRIEAKLGRTSLKVMDGPAKGRAVSLADSHVAEFLGSKAPEQKPARIVVTYGKYVEGWISEARGGQKLDQQMATLEVAGISVQVSMNSVWNGRYTPMPLGEYAVLVPDAPHKQDMTRFYRRVAPGLKFDQVWFPIKYRDNSRFVHVGNLSEGCTTVLDLEQWPDIHEALISHRSLDGASVAQLVVRGTPERAR